MKPRTPVLSKIVANHHHVTPRHARRLIVAKDPRVDQTLEEAFDPAAESVAKFVFWLRGQLGCEDETPRYGRLQLMIALSDGTFPPKLRGKVEAAFELLLAGENAMRRAAVAFHEIDSETSRIGILADVASMQKELDAEQQQKGKL